MDKEYTKRASKKDKELKTFNMYGKNTTKGLRRKMEIIESKPNMQNNKKLN